MGHLDWNLAKDDLREEGYTEDQIDKIKDIISSNHYYCD